MANSKRLFKNNEGKIFIPMNVEGGVWEDNFFTTQKVIVLAILLVLNFLVIVWTSNLVNKGAKILFYILIFIADQFIIRKVIFEEHYYYRMYQKMKNNSITTPNIFWDIISLKDTEDGAILIYSDMKLGIFVRVERDTIIGKSEEFREQHFDAISDFYRELNLRRYTIVQLNIMEQAGKDPRLQQLDELVVKTDNKNLAKLIEMQVGYIKTITRATLFESDYFFIYTKDLSRSDRIISDVIDCIYKLLDGGFISYKILSIKDIQDLAKELYGVKYFNYVDAIMDRFKSSDVSVGKILNIKEIEFYTGESIKIDGVGINRLNILTSYINKNNIKYGEWTIKDALNGKIKSNASKQVNVDNEDNANSSMEYIDLDNYAFGVNTDDNKHEKKENKKNRSVESSEHVENLYNKNQIDITTINQQKDKNENDFNENITSDDDIIDF
jgi:hypothetical protein